MMKWVAVAAVCLLATFLRFHDLEAQSLWHDEGNSLRLAERNITDLVDASSRDIHPPGYYIALKVWIHFAGDTEFGLRSLSAFWGVLTVVATFALALQLTARRPVAIGAAFFVAINPFAVYYAQETRMYAQLGALSIIGLWLLTRFMASSSAHQWRWGVALAVCNVLGLYTHYTYPFTMIVQGIYFVWVWQHQRQPSWFLAYIVLNGITLTCFLPWVNTAYQQVTTWPSTGDSTDLLTRLERIATILLFGHTIDNVALIAFIPPMILVLLAVLPTSQSVARLLIPIGLIVISIGALLTSGAYREANLKFLIPAQAAVALLLSMGIARLSEAPGNLRIAALTYTSIIVLPGLVVASIFPALNALYTDTTYARSDYRGIATAIESTAPPNSVIVLNAPNQQEVFSYYHDGMQPVVGLPRGLGGDDASTASEVQQLLAQYERIFLVLWGQRERDPNAVVQRTLDNEAFVVKRQWFNDVELLQYVAHEVPPQTPEQPLTIAFDNLIELQGYTLSDDTFVVGRGDALGVALYWRALQEINNRYKISVQLLTANGVLAEQHDSEPANGLRPTVTWIEDVTVIDNHGLLLNDTLSPGRYSLNVVVYDATDATIRLQPDNGNPAGIVELAVIDIILQYP